MGEFIDSIREMKQFRSEMKHLYGVDCPGCREKQPKRIPTRLMPGQKCKVCGYRAPNIEILKESL